MTGSRNDIEFADRISRRRYIGTTAATIAYIGAQFASRPVFRADAYPVDSLRQYLWAVNALVLLLLVLPMGGWIWGKRVRSLVNDEISRAHSRTAIVAGFWVSMIIAIGIHVLPGLRDFSAREATYLIVCPVAALVPLYFAWLEARALRDG